MYIGLAGGGYGGAVDGGLYTNVSGFTSLYSVNGNAYTEILRCTWSGATFNAPLGMDTNSLTCGPVNATTGSFSGAVSCGGTLTCAGNSISMTDGTGAFSVTPTMMRALYSYYATLGTTAVGTLTNYTIGAPTQHTTGSGVYYPVVSVNLASGSYNLTAMVLLI